MARTITLDRLNGDRAFGDRNRRTPSSEELDNIAHWLDSKFSIFGIRFGIEPILGIVPGVGDLVGLGMSSYLLLQAYRMGVRKRTMARMIANVAGDTVFGSIPVLGTVVDVFWKANRANMQLLKRDLERGNLRSRT
ncbi:DUF4112 domain-containing protein [Acuticoccus sp. M5D2P5]|uniref:DUF4112 domain-containing protein n=1 Tax=Acuticoccus kalidii TaxID=2910977 RepID=UPI001F1D2318|nr:DUF4112 domain-containing protein [Acuticoccus kalidii]MCF3933544.1 DUF4112 domain-containing protein [Acuticoccus kalidii]